MPLPIADKQHFERDTLYEEVAMLAIESFLSTEEDVDKIKKLLNEMIMLIYLTQ